MLLPSEKRQEAVAALQKMISLLGLDAEVADASHDDVNVLSVKTAKPGRLIGRKGIYLSSMELLLNRMVQKKSDEFVPIRIDIDGYERGGKDRAADAAEPGAEAPAAAPAETAEPAVAGEGRRERFSRDRGDRGERGDRGGRGRDRDRGDRGERGERFERHDRHDRRGGEGRSDRMDRGGGHGGGAPDVAKLALDAAKEVRLWGQPKTLGPFSSVERKLIHDALNQVSGVEAVSGPDLGGNRKTVSIHIAGTVPKPEPGAAPAAAEEGGQA